MRRRLASQVGRRAAFRDTLPKLLVLTEGRLTEPLYLEGLCRRLQLPSVTIEGPAGVPKTMVEVAVARKQDYDSVWCVFDVDDHPKLIEALQQAKDNGVSVALSGPCFEIFLLLHFEFYSRPCHRREVQHRLRDHIQDYDKRIRFAEVWPLYEVAIANNNRLDAWHKSRGQQFAAPFTTVFGLTETLRKMRTGL